MWIDVCLLSVCVSVWRETEHRVQKKKKIYGERQNKNTRHKIRERQTEETDPPIDRYTSTNNLIRQYSILTESYGLATMSLLLDVGCNCAIAIRSIHSSSFVTVSNVKIRQRYRADSALDFQINIRA